MAKVALRKRFAFSAISEITLAPIAWKTCRNGWGKLNALHPLYIINSGLMRSSFSRTNLPFLSNFARIGKK